MGTGTRISRRSASGGDDCYFHLDIWRRRRRCSANSYVHKCAHGFETRGCAHGCACSHDGSEGHGCARGYAGHGSSGGPRCACPHDGSGGHGDASSHSRTSSETHRCAHGCADTRSQGHPRSHACAESSCRYCRARNGSSTHGCAYTSITTLFPVGESSCYHF